MIKRFIYNILFGCSIVSLMMLSACSEDSLSPIDELGETIYDPSATPEEASINAFYEKYGTKILHDFKSSDLAFGWSSSRSYWYAPIKDEYKHYIDDVATFLNEKAFQKYPDIFIKKYLPFRIFLVDSICSTITYDEDRLQDVMKVETHGIAIAHVGKEMDDWTEDNWNTLQDKVIALVMNSIYQPFKDNNIIQEFEDLQSYTFSFPLETDPQDLEGIYISNIEYPLYKNGYVGGTVEWDEEEVYPPFYQFSTDFAQYISFILTTPKKKMDMILTREVFALTKQRALLIVSLIKNELGLNIIQMQNEACPDDPYPADYFDE